MSRKSIEGVLGGLMIGTAVAAVVLLLVAAWALADRWRG